MTPDSPVRKRRLWPRIVRFALAIITVIVFLDRLSRLVGPEVTRQQQMQAISEDVRTRFPGQATRLGMPAAQDVLATLQARLPQPTDSVPAGG
jgi:hypothetical protein